MSATIMEELRGQGRPLRKQVGHRQGMCTQHVCASAWSSEACPASPNLKMLPKGKGPWAATSRESHTPSCSSCLKSRSSQAGARQRLEHGSSFVTIQWGFWVSHVTGGLWSHPENSCHQQPTQPSPSQHPPHPQSQAPPGLTTTGRSVASKHWV